MIVLIKTPLQLICAMEYLHKKKIDSKNVHFVYIRKYSFNDLHIDKTFTYFNIHDFKILNFQSSSVIIIGGKKLVLNKLFVLKPFVKLYQILFNWFSKRKLKNLLSSHECIVLGDPNLKLFEQLTKKVYEKKIVLLDDGLSSMNLSYNYNTNKHSVESFSFLRVANDGLRSVGYVENEFELIKKNIIEVDEKKIIFLGQPLYEANILSLNEIREVFMAIGKVYKDFKIIYFPHRWEFSTNLYNLPDNIMVQKDQDYPIEIFIYKMTTLPKEVISFYSTALVTLKRMLPKEINFTAVDFLLSNKNEKLRAAYDLFGDFEIPVLEIKQPNI